MLGRMVVASGDVERRKELRAALEFEGPGSRSGGGRLGCSMKKKGLKISLVLMCVSSALVLGGCGKVHAQADADAATSGAPPEAKVVPYPDASLFSVDHPEQFPLATATERPATSELVVTGTVTPDVSRNVPVVSLASGRVMAIQARLGDTVQKGQLLMTIRSDDVSGGYSTYRKAVADEVLARAQYERAKDLYEHGAIALNDLQVAQDTEDKAKMVVETAAEHLRLLGNDPRSRTSWWISSRRPRESSPISKLPPARWCRPTTRPTRSPFPISRPSGSSATCTRTIWPPSNSATPRRSR